MIIEISAVFKVIGEDIMYAKPSASFEAEQIETTPKRQYEALKKMVKQSLPEGYEVIDATQEEINAYNEDN